ncbi:unnamed protein product [Callosobruchus maculatus]|uniref:Uncharacterized protein n=1 Tax=Callosobruchus maculatus TaxID=64391 RepID=A0A653CA17_CALMS|nr:unnamed protein product [Callosobruchus maculatus]
MANPDEYARRRRPFGGGNSLPPGCQFRRQPQLKPQGTGRFLVDLAYVNVANNYQTNILCVPGGAAPSQESGGSTVPALGGGGGHKPILSHKPILGGNGGNRPLLSMIIANRPLETLVGAFSQSQSQSQSQGQSGILGDFVSGFASVLPSAQQVGQGLGEGLSSFVQTIPQIGQSFASLLPNFGAPQSPSVLPAEPPQDPLDPDDILHNVAKPVHESIDPVTGRPYTRVPPAKDYNQKRYQTIKKYQYEKDQHEYNKRHKFDYATTNHPQYTYQGRRNGEETKLESRRGEGRSFRFPT